VRIKYQGGCIAYKCIEEHIGIQDSCKADFERLSYSGSNPLSAYYKALPWHNNNKKPEQICWNFGDNHDTCINYSTTSTNYVVGHIYAHEGTYNVCVRIKYQGGCIAYKCKEIEIEDENKDHCRADFEKLNSNANDPLQAYYKALPWNSEQKKPKRICWTFGDGKDTCIQYAENYTGYYVVSHHYSHTGSYEVCVTINYYGECEAKKCRTILITTSNDSCHVHLFEISPAITSLTRTFYVVTTASNGNPIRVCWYFGDGKDTCIVATNSTPPSLYITHTYPAPGEYHACVKVLFQNGCLAEDCHKVIIRSLTGICGGYYTDSLDNPHTYTFKGFSIHNPNDAVLSYRWTFGDGTSGTGQKITHTFSQPGVYRVCLLINTEKGCETRICNDVRVGGTTQSTLQLSPNPVINNLHLVFYSNHNEAVTIRIFAAGGVAVRTYVRNAVIGANTWDFDVSTLISGVYLLTVESPNQFASGIFFKL
jgi:PKD repeat protein